MSGPPAGGAGDEHVYDDLSYDMAHEEVSEGDDSTADTTPVTVATETADTEGDYSYDLAHDIPKADPDNY